MHHKFSFRDKLRYAFDSMMSKGTSGLIIWLGVLSIILIVVLSIVVLVTKTTPGDEGFIEMTWMSLMRTLDPGTMGGDEGGAFFLLIMLCVTLGGIFIISALIGIVTTSLEARLESLRKGRSRVVERGHTIVLGWTEQVFTIISELTIANENQRSPCIAIMADMDKVEMEDEIRSKISSTKNTRIVCRTGNPAEPSDLEIMSLVTSKSIIILSPEGNNPDPEVIKIMLAIINNPSLKSVDLNIVALIRDPENVEVAHIVGRDKAEIVLAGDIVARMTAQTCLQSGLSIVYQELLDYGGDEIYFHTERELFGKTFREAIFMYDTSSVIGIISANGQPVLNPPMDTIISKGDRIIAVSEDDDTLILSGRDNLEIDREAIRRDFKEMKSPGRIIMLGWNWRAPIIIRELDNYVQPGSFMKVVADEAICNFKGEDLDLENLELEYATEITTDRRVLEGLKIEDYDHIIILCYTDSMDAQEADAATLMTLLHIRDITEKRGGDCTLVSEMKDIRNRNLAEITGADDYIVSDQMLSLLLTQISENRHLSGVFWDLFDPEGSEIYLKPVERYVRTDVPVNFYTVAESAASRGEVAIGYRLSRLKDDADRFYGVVVNPVKHELISFGEGDAIITLSEN
ncbi:MAG: potassium transporter TrkA [Candidatus Aegiribacteria sp.]|nr:potassium transporter TrkA [Candidatus Aegiribacteria sp.]